MTDHETYKAAAFWDKEIGARTHVSWMGDPAVRRYINGRVTACDAWPLDWFEQWVATNYRANRQPATEPVFRQVLSIGCGTGALERDLVRRNMAVHVDAYDASPESIAVATSEAQLAGMATRITYLIADFNAPPRLRRTYDAIFFHQSLHHVWKLERLFGQTLRMLRSTGVVYLDEYVGPSRFEWTPELLRAQNELYAQLPPEVRKIAELPPPIQEDDPSEAFRSSEIIPLLERGFHVVERRDYGGTLLSILFPVIDFTNAPPQFIDELIRAEEKLLDSGAPSYYTIIVARPKRIPRRWYAATWYYLQPKLRRLRWELRQRLFPNRHHEY